MDNASTTATTNTAPDPAPTNVTYTTGDSTGQNYNVTPHTPTPR